VTSVPEFRLLEIASKEFGAKIKEFIQIKSF
jgi:hypothetical protein